MKKFFLVLSFFFIQVSYAANHYDVAIPKSQFQRKYYSSSFMDTLKNIAFELFYGKWVNSQIFSDVKIPINVRLLDGWDTVYFGFKFRGNLVVQEAQIGICPDSWKGYYKIYQTSSKIIYSYSIFSMISPCSTYPGISSYFETNGYLSTYISAYNSFYNGFSVCQYWCYKGIEKGIIQFYDRIYSVQMATNYNLGQMRENLFLPNIEIINDSNYQDFVSAHSLTDTYDNFPYRRTTPGSEYNFVFSNDVLSYLNSGYITPSPIDISSDTSNTEPISFDTITVIGIDLSTTNLLLTQIRDKINFSTITGLLTDIRDRISTAPVNVSVDLSTTNKYLKGLYDVWADTSVVVTTATIIGGEVLDSVSQTTSTIMAIYDDIRNFFSVTFPTSTIWNCHFDFGQISFLNKNFILGDYDLCSDPPQGLGLLKYFNLLKMIIRLLFVALSIEVMIRGWINAL